MGSQTTSIWLTSLRNPRQSIQRLDGWDRWRHLVLPLVAGFLWGLLQRASVQNQNPLVLGFLLGILLLLFELAFGVMVLAVQRVFAVKLSLYQIYLSLGWAYTPTIAILSGLFVLQYLWDQASLLAAIGLLFGFWYFLQNYSSLANKSYGSAWLVVQAAALLLILLVGTVFWLVRLGLPSESAWVPFGHGRVT